MTLRSRLRRIRRRVWMVGSAAALAWGMVAAVLLLVVAAWLDLVWEMSPQARMAAAATAATAGAVVWTERVAATLRSGSDRRLARRVDRAGNLGGRVLTGLDLERRTASEGAGSPLSPLSSGLARMAVEEAGRAAAAVPTADSYRYRSYSSSGGAAAAADRHRLDVAYGRTAPRGRYAGATPAPRRDDP